jgi:FMN-dependent NADH-azoreductase
MPTLLHLDASATQETSVSRAMSAEFVRGWIDLHPEAEIRRHDLAVAKIPPITQDWIVAAFTPANLRTDTQRRLLKLSDELVEELKVSDVIVLGTSMYNFAAPAALKLWIDQIVRLGDTYAYIDDKRQGILTGKKAYIFIASGGIYEANSPTAAMDFLSPYLRTILGYVGISDVTIHCAGGTQALLKPGADRRAFIEKHLEHVRALQIRN